MRADADLLDEHHDHHGAHLLRAEADRIEREHTERAAFIDELAKVYADGMQYFAIEDDWLGWEDLSEINREAIRAGIRAVLARLDELDGDGNDTKTLRQWKDLRDVPDDVREVIGCETTRFQRDSSSPSGWIWPGDKSPVGPFHMSACAPYVEVIDQ